jgi:NTE family protein
MSEKKYKTGLVLGGGGSRGFTHLGVAKALYEKGIFPDVISGVSAGSIAGSLLADGHDPSEIFEILCSKKFFSYTRLRFSKFGLLNMNGLHKLLKSVFKTDRVENLKIPFYVAVTNLNSGMIEYRTEGPIIDLVCASSSIPFIFKPVKIDGNLYVDGGLIDNLPIFPIRNLCERLIIVNLIPIRQHTEFKSRRSLFGKIADVTVYHHIKAPIYNTDTLIESTELSKYSYFNNKKAREMFDLGYRITMNTSGI